MGNCKNVVTVEEMRNNPALMSEDTLAGLWADAEAAEKVLREACAVYQQDLRKRQATIDQQQTEFAKQIQATTAKQKEAEANACNHVSRGNLTEAEKCEQAAEELGKQIAAAERKHRILSRVNLEGDPNLYAAVSRARDARDTAWAAAQKEANAAYHLAVELEERFQKLHKVANRNSMRATNDSGYDAVFQHFNRKILDQSRLDADQKRREQEAAEAAKRHVTCIR